MNICFYTDYTLSSMTGGIGRVTTVLTDYFRNKYGWKVFSIFAFPADKNCTLTETDGAIRLRLHDRLGFRNLSKNYQDAAQFIKNNNIQIVIIQTSMDVVARLKRVLNKIGLADVKVISVLHYTPGTDEFPISTQGFFKDIAHGKISLKDCAKTICAPFFNCWEHKATVSAYKKAYKYGDKVIVLSQSYISLYQKYAGISECSKLKAIPNCVPFEYHLSSEELQQKQNKALVVGRMVDFPKRISLILNLWKSIEESPETNDWSLDIVGDGPDLESFKSLASRLGLSRVNFEGRQNPIGYYKEASIFLMVSEFEGFPMTLVEAQQMGCVPIAFNSFDSLREVVCDGKNGLIIPNNNNEQYTNALLGLMGNAKRREEMAVQATIDCRKYSQEEICSLWKTELEQLAQ